MSSSLQKEIRMGNIFGFVRFADEGQGEELLLNLGNVSVRSTILKVNVSRFARELVASSTLADVGLATILSLSGVAPDHRAVAGLSFAAAAVAAPSTGSREIGEIVCEVAPGRLRDLSTSVVGVLQPHMSVQKVREQLIIA